MFCNCFVIVKTYSKATVETVNSTIALKIYANASKTVQRILELEIIVGFKDFELETTFKQCFENV